jgi:hypothetical protein
MYTYTYGQHTALWTATLNPKQGYTYILSRRPSLTGDGFRKGSSCHQLLVHSRRYYHNLREQSYSRGAINEQRHQKKVTSFNDNKDEPSKLSDLHEMLVNYSMTNIMKCNIL